MCVVWARQALVSPYVTAPDSVSPHGIHIPSAS